MSLAKRIAEYEKPKIGGVCSTCTVISEANDEDKAALLAAMDDPRISNAGLSRILREEGYEIGDSALRRHRKGECKGL